MFLQLFTELRQASVPVSLREYLTLMEALDREAIERSPEQFYYLARTALVKDEKNLDKFDRVFAHVFRGLESAGEAQTAQIPDEWLRSMIERHFTEEEKALIEAMGGLDKLMETLAERLKEQNEEHHGGSKWIGTGGTSPFGSGGYNPEGVRIGGQGQRQGRAVKVWDKREYRNLDDSVELGTRNIKVALRRLRRFAREGAAEELDLDETIGSTARHGYLDIVLRPERRNAVKVLLFLDVGGSMDPHVKVCEELFSAAKSEFKRLEFFYFHNFLYEGVWKDNRRRFTEKIATFDILHRFPHDYKVVFVGDATMGPYEITHPGGSVEHWNEESGAAWMQRLTDVYEHVAWFNPIAERYWDYNPSIQVTRRLMGDRMYSLTLDGLERGMRDLAR